MKIAKPGACMSESGLCHLLGAARGDAKLDSEKLR
jgi:hypothetical protein